MEPLLGKDLPALAVIASECGLPKFAAGQMARWLYQNHVRAIGDMTNLSKQARETLVEKYDIGASEPVEVVTSHDGTEKALFPTQDGHHVETVYIPSHSRGTLCVSTQVGCKMRCAFCQTGLQGFQGNLSVSDILSQVEWGIVRHDIDNVVLMGQGEPLDNIDNVLAALHLLTEAKEGYGWSPKRVTLSTVGIPKPLRRFLDESQCNLAVSLHSPLPEQRAQLMPAERMHPFAETLALLRQYDWTHQRRLSFEYVMLRGVTDSRIHAKTLLSLLKGVPCRINLIRFHHTDAAQFEGTGEADIEHFRDYLTQHGLFTTIRASRGEDIWAACGMLHTSESAHATRPQDADLANGQ